MQPIKPYEMESPEAIQKLFARLVRQGAVAPTYRSQLRVFGAVAKAQRMDFPGPFAYSVIRHGQWHWITQADEDIALSWLRELRRSAPDAVLTDHAGVNRNLLRRVGVEDPDSLSEPRGSHEIVSAALEVAKAGLTEKPGEAILRLLNDSRYEPLPLTFTKLMKAIGLGFVIRVNGEAANSSMVCPRPPRTIQEWELA